MTNSRWNHNDGIRRDMFIGLIYDVFCGRFCRTFDRSCRFGVGCTDSLGSVRCGFSVWQSSFDGLIAASGRGCCDDCAGWYRAGSPCSW